MGLPDAYHLHVQLATSAGVDPELGAGGGGGGGGGGGTGESVAGGGVKQEAEPPLGGGHPSCPARGSGGVL